MQLSDFVQRADQILALGERARATSGRTPYGGSHLSEDAFMEFRAAALSFLKNAFGDSHPYYQTFNTEASTAVEFAAKAGLGIMAAAKAEMLGGWSRTATGIVSAEIFTDFLEMAEYLLNANYKDAAAVIVGGVLEEHLRQLCRREGIAVQVGTKPKAADHMNADLAAQSVYSKLDQKSITTSLDLRNKAAHGRYSEYVQEQVALMLQAVQNFMTRVPV